MIIRKFVQEDACAVGELFFQTVHTINAKDYAPELLSMWAPNNDEFTNLVRNCHDNIFYVVEHESILVGFGDMRHDGHLERLFVHKDFQGKKIGTMLLNKIEQEAHGLGLSRITTEASIRAQPFFLKHGFEVIKRLYKKHEHKGLDFITYKMVKYLK